MSDFFNLIVASLAVSGLATLLSRSYALEPVRVRVRARSHYLGELVGCAYCLSHWIALVVVALLPIRIFGQGLICYFVSVFAVVALSVIFTGLMDTFLYAADSEIRRLRKSLNESADTIEQLIQNQAE